MPYIIFLALVIVIATLPVMFAARMVNAGRTGFGTALLAVFLQTIFSGLIHMAALSPPLFILLAVIGGSAIYAAVLKTTFWKGFAVAVLVVVISLLLAVIFGTFIGGLAVLA